MPVTLLVNDLLQVEIAKFHRLTQPEFNICHPSFVEINLKRKGVVMSIHKVSRGLRFLRDTGGSVMPVFVMAMLPVLGLAGMAIDYTRANSANAKMQKALDATALAISPGAATLSETALNTQASSFFSAIYRDLDALNPTVTASYTTANGPQVVLTGTAAIKTYFAGLPPIGVPRLNIGSSSTIKWPRKKPCFKIQAILRVLRTKQLLMKLRLSSAAKR